MDDRRLTTLVQSLGRMRNRRTVLKGLFGVGASATAAYGMAGKTDAARRGFSGPKFPEFPTPTPTPCINGTAECVVPEGGTSILICDQGTWQAYDCVNGQVCISYPDANDFCEITT